MSERIDNPMILPEQRGERGYFEIGIYHAKKTCNVGTLWRSAYIFGAAGIFTIGERIANQSSDTNKSWRHIPYRTFAQWSDWVSSRPYDSLLIGIECGGKPLKDFVHPRSAIYLLGAEDHGLPLDILNQCQATIGIPTARPYSLNVAMAGTLVMYDRYTKYRQPNDPT